MPRPPATFTAARARLALTLGVSLVVFGCAQDPAAPTAATGRPAFNETSSANATFTLVAQLSAIGNPNIDVGHLTLQLTQAIGDPNVFVATFYGHLLKLEGQSYSGGGIFGIGDPTIRLIDLFRTPDERLNDVSFQGTETITGNLAQQMIGDPNQFTADFFISGGELVVTGQLMRGHQFTEPS